MTKISDTLPVVLRNIPGFDEDQLKKAQRVAYIHHIWESIVEPVFLEHTNGVYLFTRNQRKELHIYVDESIFASELNNQRELLKLEIKERFHEEIDDFQIHISKGKYKNIHPFKNSTKKNKERPALLTQEEKETVNKTCQTVTDPRLRECFQKAMIADLEWKKSRRGQNS